MLYLSIVDIVARRDLSVPTGGGLAAAQPPEFSAICRAGGCRTAGTMANDHPLNSHVHVIGITLVVWNCCFGTLAQYCFRDASLGLNLAAFLYIKSPLITNYISIPRGVQYIRL